MMQLSTLLSIAMYLKRKVYVVVAKPTLGGGVKMRSETGLHLHQSTYRQAASMGIQKVGFLR